MDAYYRFKAQREEQKRREKQIANSEILSSPDSAYQRFLINRQKPLEEDNDFAKELKNKALKRTVQQKIQEKQDFLDSDENVGFWESLAPGGAKPSDWWESRKKKKQYGTEINEAAAQVAAYEQFLKQQEFQKEIDGMTVDDIDFLLADYDSRIKQIRKEKGYFTNEEREVEAEQGKYRAARDEKKSREMTEGLPEDVVELLDKYNTLGMANESIDLNNMFVSASQKSHAQINTQKLNVQKQQMAIAKELQKRGYENYEELAEYRKFITDKESVQNFETEMADFTEEHPWVSSVGNLGLMPSRIITGAMGNLSALDNKSDLGINPYSPYYGLTRGNRAKKQTIENSFEDGIISADVKKFLYNTAESGAESLLAATTMGPAGGVMLGMGAMNETVLETVEKGGTAEQALMSGVLAGAAEGFFEKASLGRFAKNIDVKSLKSFIKNMAIEAGVNASEEMFTEIANIATDYYVNGGLSDYYQVYESYISQGMTEEEAKKAAFGDMAMQVFESGASGALMGVAFGGYNSARNMAGYNSAMLEEGKAIAEAGDVERELAASSELGVSENDALYKFAQEVAEYQSRKEQNSEYQATKKELRSIGKLSEGLDNFALDKVKNTSVESIESRLTALGEKGDVNRVAHAIYKKVAGEKLSAKEKNYFEKSTKALQVYREFEGKLYDAKRNRDLSPKVNDIFKSRYSPDIEAYRGRNSTESTPESNLSDTEEETPYGFENYEKQVKEKVINEGQDKERFEADFELFKAYGEAGRNFEEVKQNSTVSDDFTEAQMKAAFDLGKEKAEAQKMTVLKGVQRIEGGEIYVTDTKDNVRKLSEVNTDDTTRNLYKSAAKYDTDTANVFVQGYNRSANLSSYNKAFNGFYSAGATSTDITFSEAMQKYGSLIKHMADEGVARKAFEAGRKERTKADSEIKQKRQTGKMPSKGTYQNKTITIGEEGADEFYTALAKKTGIDIERRQNLYAANGQEANAQYEADKNKMTASASATNEWQASIHELVHYVFAYNTGKMIPVKKAVVDYFVSNNSMAALENALDKYKTAYTNATRAELEEEFIADAIGGMFSTEDGVNDFLTWLQNDSGYNANEKKTILQRITEWLNDIIEAIKEIMNDGELNGAGKLFAKENCDELAKIRKMFLEALDGAGENYREGGAVEGGERNSIDLSFDKSTDITYDSLISKPDMVISEVKTTLEEVSKLNRDEIVKNAIKKLSSKKNSEGVITLHNADTGKDIYVGKKGLSHNLIRNYEYTAMVTLNLASYLENAIKINEAIADKNRDYDSDILLGYGETATGDRIPAYFVVSKLTTGKTELIEFYSLYSINAKKIAEDSTQGSPGFQSRTSANISIANLIDVVNGVYSDILPQSVADRYGIQRRDTKLGRSVKYSLSIQSDKSEKLSELETEKKKYDDEIFHLRRDFDKLKRTDEYEMLETAIIEAHGNDEAFNSAIDEYNKWLNESGMGEINRKLTEAKAKQGELRKEIVRLQNDLHKDFMKSIESFDDETVSKYVSKAVRKFKTTNNFKLAGYLTTTGSLLDFSDGQGYRVQDHREVKDVLDMPDYAEYSDGMIAFMNMGNIRLQSYGVDISKMPNSKQIAVLRRFFNSLNGEVVVDFSQPDGHSAGSIEYPENTKADRILNDIKRYFDTGVVPELSDVERFRYSLKQSLDWVDWDEEKSLVREMSEIDEIETELREILKHEIRRQEISELDIQAVARKLKIEFKSTIDIHVLSDMLREYYNLFCGDSIVSWDVAQIHKNEIADAVLKNSKNNKAYIPEKYQEILKDIKRIKVKPSIEQKQTVASAFGSYETFRRKSYYSVVFSKDGVDLNDRWAELSEKYPDIFDSNIEEKDRALAIFEATKMLKNRYEDEYGFDYDSAKDYMTTIIAESFFDVSKSVSSESQNRAKELEARIKKVKRDYGLKYKELSKNLKKRIDRMQDTEIRKKKRTRLIKTVKRLDRLLRKPGKGAPSAGTNKYGQEYVHLTNIPEDFKRTVIDFCSVFIDNDAGVFTGNIRDGAEVLDKKIHEMQKIYSGLKKSKSYMSTVVSEDMEKKILQVAEIMGQRRLAQLSASELDTVIEIADHLTTLINNEVEMWVGNRREKVEEYAERLKTELESQKDKKYRAHFLPDKLTGMSRKIFVKSLKPGYIFEDLGETWTELHNSIYNGEARSTRNLAMCKNTVQGLMKKYHANDWLEKKDDVLEFKLETESEKIKLTREQAMSLYALSKRQSNLAKNGKETFHLDQGGFTYEKEVEVEQNGKKFSIIESKTHLFKISDFEKVDAFLTQEQKEFVDAVVKFMSKDLAAMGNEVSRELYGINLFGEEYYFPFISAQEFTERGEGKGRKKLKSPGWSNPTNHGAGNPIVLMDFTKVVAAHCKQMSIYNGEVAALENLTRMWEYTGSNPAFSMKKLVKAKYGKEYVEYIDKYIEDRNGEAFRDDSVTSELFSLFKKSAVMGSASVVIQQPSAIVRAFSEINWKYFFKTALAMPWQRVKSWEEAKKYAPVCILKEIGGYDMLGDSGITDWILEKEYKGIDKIAAFFKDSNFRDDIISLGPAFADKITWAHIWEACKKEVAKKRGLRGEELLEAAGERFTEVINKTQVYDSVSTKSDIMRSPGNKMLTSFMGEPLLNYSQLHSGFKDFGRGKQKEGVMKIASVIGQYLFNAGLVAIVYSARDDDEDKTSLEKYVSEFMANLMQNLNPLNTLPFFRDILSSMQGFDVSRTDMSVIRELIDTADNIFDFATDEEKRTSENFWDIMSGLPHWIGNIIRDGRAAWGTVGAVEDLIQGTNGTVLLNTVCDEFLSAVTFGRKKKAEKEDNLYNAWISGNSGAYEHYAAQFEKGSDIRNAIKSQIRDRYTKGKLTEDEAKAQLKKIGFNDNEADFEIRSLNEPLEKEESEDQNTEYFTFEGINSIEADDEGGYKYTYLHDAISLGDADRVKKEVEDLLSRGAEKEDIRRALTSKWGRIYKDSKTSTERKEIENMLFASGAWQRPGDVYALTREWRKQAEEEKKENE